jgi:hypothetical protein
MAAAIVDLQDEYMTLPIIGINDKGGFINVNVSCEIENGKRVGSAIVPPNEEIARKVDP